MQANSPLWADLLFAQLLAPLAHQPWLNIYCSAQPARFGTLVHHQLTNQPVWPQFIACLLAGRQI